MQLSQVIEAAKATGVDFDFRIELCKVADLTELHNLLTKLGSSQVAQYVYSDHRDKLWIKLSVHIGSFSLDSPMSGIESRLQNDPVLRGKSLNY